MQFRLVYNQCSLRLAREASWPAAKLGSHPLSFLHPNASGNLRAPAAMLSLISMYAQKFKVEVFVRGQRNLCPLEWLDQFCMRNFTNSAEFDDTLPVAPGLVEASFRLSPERFAEGLAAWLTQRGKGQGQPVRVEVSKS